LFALISGLGSYDAVRIQNHRGEVQFTEAGLYLLAVSHYQDLELVGPDQFLGDAVYVIQCYRLNVGSHRLKVIVI